MIEELEKQQQQQQSMDRDPETLIPVHRPGLFRSRRKWPETLTGETTAMPKTGVHFLQKSDKRLCSKSAKNCRLHYREVIENTSENSLGTAVRNTTNKLAPGGR